MGQVNKLLSKLFPTEEKRYRKRFVLCRTTFRHDKARMFALTSHMALIIHDMHCRWEEWDAATSRAMQQRALAGQARYGSPEAGYASDLEAEERWNTQPSSTVCIQSCSVMCTTATSLLLLLVLLPYDSPVYKSSLQYDLQVQHRCCC